MSKKLVQVASELGVGTKTVVEFLKSNGFEVVDKPTAKISDEMFEALAKFYQKSMAIKEQADQITIGSRNLPKKEEKPFKKEEVEKPLFKEPAKVELVEEPKEEIKPVVEEKPEYKLTGPKILGKIDLEEKKPKTEKKKETQETV